MTRDLSSVIRNAFLPHCQFINAPKIIPRRPLVYRPRSIRDPAHQEARENRRIQRPRVGAEEAGRLERRGNRYLYEINPHVTIDGTPRSNVARYANHSCNPNAETYTYGGRVFIRAMRNIKPDEEITYDYGNDYLKYVIGRSRCQCTRCRRRRARKQREKRALNKRRAARLARARRATRRRRR